MLEVIFWEEQTITYQYIGDPNILGISWSLNGSTIHSQVDISDETTDYDIISRVNVSFSMSGSVLECCLIHTTDANKNQCYTTTVGKELLILHLLA